MPRRTASFAYAIARGASVPSSSPRSIEAWWSCVRDTSCFTSPICSSRSAAMVSPLRMGSSAYAMPTTRCGSLVPSALYPFKYTAVDRRLISHVRFPRAGLRSSRRCATSCAMRLNTFSIGPSPHPQPCRRVGALHRRLRSGPRSHDRRAWGPGRRAAGPTAPMASVTPPR